MSFASAPKFSPDLTLRPVESSAGDDALVYILLPTLQELLGPGFGRCDAIVLPGHRRPLDGWALFGSVRERALTLH